MQEIRSRSDLNHVVIVVFKTGLQKACTETNAAFSWAAFAPFNVPASHD